jgi:hypothetical protein
MATRHNGALESGFDREILHELHEFESEAHLEDELAMSMEGEGPLHEFEFEGEFEGEQFFGRAFRRIARGVGRFVRRAAPILGRIAKVAAPLVATAVGGPLGGIIAKGATTLLGEGELEEELAHEMGLHEGHLEGIHEVHPESILHELGAHEMGVHESHPEYSHEVHPESILHELGAHEMGVHESHPEYSHEVHPESILHELEAIHEGGLHEGHLEGIHEGHPESILHELGATHEGGLHEGHLEHSQEMLAELMAEVAAGAHLEAEAEAMAGAAVVTTLSAADRAALRRLIPHLIRGAAILTRILRRRRITRPAVRTVPLIVRQTARALRQRAASGAPVTRQTAGQVMGIVTRRVLSNPRTCALAIGRNVRASMSSRQGRRPVAG